MADNGIDDQSIDFTAHPRLHVINGNAVPPPPQLHGRYGTTKLGATGEGENNNFHSRKRHKKENKK